MNTRKDGREALHSWNPHLIYLEGGNTFWLHHCIHKGNWADDIIAACTGSNAAVFCGKSAGAINAGKRVDTACWKERNDPRVVKGMEQYKDWVGVRGLSIIGNKSFFPHMSDMWENRVRPEIEKDPDVICLTDLQTCCIVSNGAEVKITILENENCDKRVN